MRTLQEKYNAIQEGKFSKEHFLAEARMQQPQLITRFNGYNDAVQILKNRGMIVEVSTEESFKDYSNDALTDMIINLSRYEDSEDTIARVKAELARRKETLQEARLTKNNLADYRYKPTNEMDKYPYEQILRGIRVELEVAGVFGTPTAEEYSKALAKVSKNLAKDSIYYTNQLAGSNKKVDLHDKMVAVTAKNTVDTFNGMKKLKDLKEDHSKKPDDKYVVRPCKNKKEPWAVWEGETRVKGFATKEEAKEYADKQNKKQGLTESVLKEGIKNLIKKALMENEEDIYEMQGPKTDAEYKRELENYLEDNQIYGYTNRLFDILTSPEEEAVADNLADFLDDHQIYGYNKGLLAIFRDYANNNERQYIPDEDEIDYDDENFSDPFIDGEDELFEGIGAGKKVTFTNKNDGEKYTGTVVRDLGNGRFTFRADQDGKVYNNDGMGSNWVIKIDEADRGGINKESDEDKLARYRSYTYMLDGEVVFPEIEWFNNYIGAELNGKLLKIGTPGEDGVVQLRSPQGKTGIYTENIFKSVSLKDLL